MNKLLLTAALTFSSFSFASTWDIDTAHAAANFSVKHLAVSTVQGTLGDVSGTVTVDDKDITKSTISISIDVKGINTKQPKRDDHLRSADFFDVEKFPATTFTSTRIEKKGPTKVLVTGDLTMHGITKSVVLDGELSSEQANPWSGARVRGFSGTTKVSRKDFGLNWNKALEAGGVLVGDEVKVEVEAEFVKKADAASVAAPAPAPAAKDVAVKK